MSRLVNSAKSYLHSHETISHLHQSSVSAENSSLLSQKLQRLEAQIHELQQSADRRYGHLKWRLDGIDQQLSSVNLWAKEAAKNTYSQPFSFLWFLGSLLINLALVLYILIK